MYTTKPAICLKASDVVRQPKIADVSRGVIKDSNVDSGSRLRTSETAPDGLYSRNGADGDTVNIGIEWTGDVSLYCNFITCVLLWFWCIYATLSVVTDLCKFYYLTCMLMLGILTYTCTHTHTTVLRLCGICPGKPGWAGTRRNIHPLLSS